MWWLKSMFTFRFPGKICLTKSHGGFNSTWSHPSASGWKKMKLQMVVEANEVRKKHRLLVFSSNWHLYPLVSSRIISFHTWKLLWPFPLTRQYPHNVLRLWFSGRHIKSLWLPLSSSDIDVTEGALTFTAVKQSNHKPAQSTYILSHVFDDAAAITKVKQLRLKNQRKCSWKGVFGTLMSDGSAVSFFTGQTSILPSFYSFYFCISGLKYVYQEQFENFFFFFIGITAAHHRICCDLTLVTDGEDGPRT